VNVRNVRNVRNVGNVRNVRNVRNVGNVGNVGNVVGLILGLELVSDRATGSPATAQTLERCSRPLWAIGRLGRRAGR
jgi:adenosylmethionine-8-amino-7-oxononanoate aminotransferase